MSAVREQAAFLLDMCKLIQRQRFMLEATHKTVVQKQFIVLL